MRKACKIHERGECVPIHEKRGVHARGAARAEVRIVDLIDEGGCGGPADPQRVVWCASFERGAGAILGQPSAGKMPEECSL